MRRWRSIPGEYGEDPRIDAFLEEVAEVSKRHGLSLAHEDRHGAFEVDEYKEENIEWLLDAHDGTS